MSSRDAVPAVPTGELARRSTHRRSGRACVVVSLGRDGSPHAHRPRYAGAVCRVRARAILNMALLDVLACITHRPGGILEQHLLLRFRHLAEQVARLLPVIVIHAMVVVRSLPLDRQRRLGEIGLVVPQAGAVWIESHCSAEIAVGAHLAVTVIALEWTFGCV